MPSTLQIKSNGAEMPAHDVLLDLETRLTRGDHRDLRLWLRLLSCTVRIENHVRSRLRQEYLTTLPRFDLMAQLEKNPCGLRMKEISRRLMVSGGNVTGITDQLEKEGLVVRRPDPNDRRAMVLQLTGHGLRKFRQIAAEHERWIAEIFAGLTRYEKDALFELLKRLKSHLGNSAAPHSSRVNSRKK